MQGDLQHFYGLQIEIVKSGLPKSLSDSELSQKIEEIFENKYPSIAENSAYYQLTPLEDSVINIL
jgi:hypothetical protein